MSTLRPEDPAADHDMNVSETGSVDGALGAAHPRRLGRLARGLPQGGVSPAMALQRHQAKIP